MNIKHIALFSLAPVLFSAAVATAQTKTIPRQGITNTPASTSRVKPAPGVAPSIGVGTGEVKLNAAALCFTCGGNWPIFAGVIPTPSAASEYGSGCSGSISTSANDRTPFLCTK